MLVSVVIPCYNVEKYIAEAIDSVLKQTHPQIEILLVDNNSTDHTIEILRRYKEDHYGQIALFEESCQGASYARNCGLQHAKGKWIQFLDADDLLQKNKIEHQLELIDTEENIDVIAGAFTYTYLSGKRRTFLPARHDDNLHALFDIQLGTTSANLWRTDSLKQINGWNVQSPCHQEYELMFRMIQAEMRFVADPTPLTILRQRESGQITYSDFHTMAKYRLVLYEKWLEWIKKHRSEWYEKNLSFIHLKLLYAVDSLGSFEPEKAKTLFNKYLSKKYRPDWDEIKQNNKYRYLLLYGINFDQYLFLKNAFRKFLAVGRK